MPRRPPDRMQKYRTLADKDLFEVETPEFRELLRRASREGLEMVSGNFNTLGMFRAPTFRSIRV